MHTQPENRTTPEPKVKQPRFISLRWRFIYPLFVIILVTTMTGAYILARNLGSGMQVSQTNILLQSSRATAQRAADLYIRHRQEAQRVAFTVGVGEAIRDRQGGELHNTLESLARLAQLDSILVTDATGLEVIGLQRARAGGSTGTDYAVSAGTDLGNEAIIKSVIEDGYVGATGLLRTPEGIVLYTAVPVTLNDQQIGVAMVGQRLDSMLVDLQGSAAADLMLYGPNGQLLQTTFRLTDTPSSLTLAPEVYNQAITAVQQIPVQPRSINGIPYQGAYFPFNYGPNTLGVIGTLMPDNVPFSTELGRQLIALAASTLAGVVVIAVFVGVSVMTRRIDRVTMVARALAAGQHTARTGLPATDEIGAMGQALDQFADHAQEKQDSLRQALRRQRREAAHLLSILESLPDGVVVQDLEGRVILMNELARQLLGSQRVFRSSGIHELSSVITQVLGPSLAPGIYALGDPQRIDLDDKMLSAQAAAVMSMSNQRLGTVIILRDITEHVRQERAREALMGKLVEDIQQPLLGLARAGARSQTDLVNAFAREITRHAVALQKMIADMREISDIDLQSMQRAQKPIRLETLLWAVANEWRQVARAANLTLHVIIERKGLYILGDERRLRWAMGNVVDNAIKYTLPGGALTLEIQDESNGMGNLRVRDNGVGITKDELPHIFTRFYRGNPVSPSGKAVRVPGMGQGLSIARQIFEAHGGTIRVKSSPGVGTAVYMSLPLTSPVSMELPLLETADMDGETVLLDAEQPDYVENQPPKPQP